MKNKNAGITTIIIIVILAIIGIFYYNYFTHPMTRALDSTPSIPIESPEPHNPDSATRS